MPGRVLGGRRENHLYMQAGTGMSWQFVRSTPPTGLAARLRVRLRPRLSARLGDLTARGELAGADPG